MCYSQFFWLGIIFWLGSLFSTAVGAVVVAKLVMLGILSLTSFILATRAAVVAKLVILGITPLSSFTLALRVVLVTKLVISSVLLSIFLILAYTSFLVISFFTTSLSLLKSTETGTNLSTSNLSTCLNYLEHFSIYQYLLYLRQILN